MALQLGNQVGQRHVHEAAGGYDQEIRQHTGKLRQQKVTHHAAQSGHSAGHRHLDQRGPRIAFGGLTQHHQITHVMRYLVGEYGHRGNHAQAPVGHKGRGNQNAVTECMDAVAQQHGPAPASVAMAVAMPVGVMRVMAVL